MTVGLKDILTDICCLVSYKADRAMSDDDFIACIDAINLLCNLCDELGIDRTEIRKKMDGLYPEFSRRIHGKKNIQLSMPLIKALYCYIYGRRVDNDDLGSRSRRNALAEVCLKVVAAYRREPMMHSADYLYALLLASHIADHNVDDANMEYRNMINNYAADIEDATVEEQLRRVWAYDKSRGYVAVDWEKWTEVRESLKSINVRLLDDETFLIWCSVARQQPLRELERRSVNSRRMRVEYLRSFAYCEIEKERRAAEKRKLNRALKGLNDEIIGDIINMKIDADMSVSTLFALETIYFLRLQLAQWGNESKEPVYEGLCRDRYEQIAKVLTKKYPKVANVNEKIEILERLEAIEIFIRNEHSRFALEKSEGLKELYDLTDLQRFRILWMFGLESDNLEKIIDRLLPQVKNTFDIKVLSDIAQFGNDAQRKAVMNLYRGMFDKALSGNDTAELGRLLSIGAYWNSSPSLRPALAEFAMKSGAIGGLSLPEKRVNAIAAEIYARIDDITGKYEDIDSLTA